MHKGENMKSTTKNTFNSDVLSSKKTVLLDVWAPWCGPCRSMEPILDALAEEVKDKVDVVKLNAQDEMELAQELGVQGLPTFLIYNNGKITGSVVGMTSKANLISLLSKTA